MQQDRSDINQVQKLVEVYYAEHGEYPSTGGLSRVYTDSNCTRATDSDGAKTEAWVPDIDTDLPQSIPNRGVGGDSGCYMYASNGNQYIITAWNNIDGGPQDSVMYRRVGFRETPFFGANSYLCNHGNIGGVRSAGYDASTDYYKYSYTLSNITNCNETPPAGA